MTGDRRDDPTEQRRRVMARIDAATADRATAEARRAGIGLDLVVEQALRTYLDIGERDRRNPRPDPTS